MRPVSERQSALRAPLNPVFGTETSVRILRELALSAGSLTSGDLARAARLQPSGVRRTLDRLVEAGVVERVTAGRRRQVRLRASHPLAMPIVELFKAELRRVEDVFEEIRKAARQLSPPPLSVWVQGPVARELDGVEDPVIVGFLAASGELRQMETELRSCLSGVEAKLDVTIELRGVSKADLAVLEPKDRAEFSDIISVLGPLPSHYWADKDGAGDESPGPVREVDRHPDDRIAALTAAIAEKLKYDPSLVDRARSYVRERLAEASAGEKRELAEWDHILSTMSLPRLRRFLVDESPRAVRLRQTLPFLDVLTQSERQKILRGVE